MNPDTIFSKAAIERRSKVSSSTVNRELRHLFDVKFVKSKIAVATAEGQGKVKGWQLDKTFQLLTPLRNLLFTTEPFTREEIVRKFKNGGRIKLIVTAGVFIQDENSRADILIVGDNLNKRIIDNTLHSMEAEIGRELVYGVFETEDFKYRLTVYDKFVRDLLDYPHNVVLDKLGINHSG